MYESEVSQSCTLTDSQPLPPPVFKSLTGSVRKLVENFDKCSSANQTPKWRVKMSDMRDESNTPSLCSILTNRDSKDSMDQSIPSNVQIEENNKKPTQKARKNATPIPNRASSKFVDAHCKNQPSTNKMSNYNVQLQCEFNGAENSSGIRHVTNVKSDVQRLLDLSDDSQLHEALIRYVQSLSPNNLPNGLANLKTTNDYKQLRKQAQHNISISIQYLKVINKFILKNKISFKSSE